MIFTSMIKTSVPLTLALSRQGRGDKRDSLHRSKNKKRVPMEAWLPSELFAIKYRNIYSLNRSSGSPVPLVNLPS